MNDLFDRIPLVDFLNWTYGEEIARGVRIGHLAQSPYNFGRLIKPEKGEVPTDRLSVIHDAYTALAGALGVSRVAIPPAFVVANNVIVSKVVGHGYSGAYLNSAGAYIGPELAGGPEVELASLDFDVEPNPNPNGMGLGTDETETAVAVTNADAPSAAGVYFDPKNPDKRVAVAVSGIWNQLVKGTVSQTLELVRSLVGAGFDPRHLWLNLTAGARGGNFRLNQQGVDILATGGIVYRQFVFRDDFGPAPAGAKDWRPYSLDLAGLFYALWVQAGVPFHQIGFDHRDVADPRNELASKRVADAGGKAYASAAQAIVLV